MSDNSLELFQLEQKELLLKFLDEVNQQYKGSLRRAVTEIYTLNNVDPLVVNRILEEIEQLRKQHNI